MLISVMYVPPMAGSATRLAKAICETNIMLTAKTLRRALAQTAARKAPAETVGDGP